MSGAQHQKAAAQQQAAAQQAAAQQAAAQQAAIEQAAAQAVAAQQAAVTPAPAPVAAPSAGGGDELIAQLTKLGELKVAGILTDAEFAAAKAKLLG